MAITVKHNKVSTIPDTDDTSLVRPSDWNADHTLVGTIDVANGGTGANTLTGYVKGNGTNAMTAVATVPSTDITGLGTMSTQNANAVVITGGTINGTTIGATTPSTVNATLVTTPSVTATATDLTLAAISTGAVNLNTAGGTGFRISDNGSMTSFWETFGGTGTNILSATGTPANVGALYRTKGASGHQFTTAGSNSNTQFTITHTASAVNYAQITGAAAGSDPTLSAQGSDTNINFTYLSKGSAGEHRFSTNTGGNTQFRITHTGSAVNYLTVTGAIAGAEPVLSAQGAGTNIPLALQPKGTGAIQAQATTSTTAGGNARGANATDFQKSRFLASQVASGSSSTIGGGLQSTASGYASTVAGGDTNTASAGYSSVVGGNNNIASGNQASVVNGISNSATGFYGFVGNGFTNSTTANAAVTTQATTAVTSGSTAVTLSATNASIKVGQYITGTGIAADTYVSAISTTSLTLSKNATATGTPTLSFFTPHGVVVGGGNNQATGSYSFIGGGGDAGTAANRNRASGDWSFVGGGGVNTASGLYSYIAGGFANTASGQYSSIGGGYLHTASGTMAVVAGGYVNTASGDYSSILGGVRGTTRSIAGFYAMPAHVNPIADVAGVSQAGLLILGTQTTDATATALRSNSSAAGTTNQVILPNNSAYYFRGEIISGVTGGGNTKGFFIEGVIKRGANAASTTLVGTPTVTSNYADAGASAWTIAVTADTTNGGLRVTFTGQAATTIRTVAQIRTTEMTY